MTTSTAISVNLLLLNMRSLLVLTPLQDALSNVHQGKLSIMKPWLAMSALPHAMAASFSMETLNVNFASLAISDIKEHVLPLALQVPFQQTANATHVEKDANHVRIKDAQLVLILLN